MGRNFSNTSHSMLYADGSGSSGSTAAVDFARTVQFLPKNWKGDGTVPLVVYCHGAGQNGLDPFLPAQFGQQGNLTALAEAGWPILSCDLGGPFTWGRQSAPTGRQNVHAAGASGPSITATLPAPSWPRSLLRISVLYSSAAPTTPASTGFTNIPGAHLNNTGNFQLYVLYKVATGGEAIFPVTNIPAGATSLEVIVEEVFGWAGTPTLDYISVVNGANATNLPDVFAHSPVLASELAMASAIWGGAVGNLAGIWGSATAPPGTSMAVNYPGSLLATLGVNGVGAVSGFMGTSATWTTVRNAALADTSFYDSVTAPDFTNAFTVIDYLNDAISWAAANMGAKTTKIGLFGTSMGGLNALYYLAHNLSKVGCFAGVGPVNDLNDMVSNNRGGFASSINGCYPGGYSNATYGANHDPTTMASNGNYGSVPMQLWYGASDTVVMPSTVQNFASLVGQNCNIFQVPGGHAESTWAEVDTDKLVAFFLQNLGL